MTWLDTDKNVEIFQVHFVITTDSSSGSLVDLAVNMVYAGWLCSEMLFAFFTFPQQIMNACKGVSFTFPGSIFPTISFSQTTDIYLDKQTVVDGMP